MNNFESRQSQPKLNKDEGWLVQIYGSNRRLLCVLEPSHGWIFLLGFGVGVLLSVILINVNVSSNSSPPESTLPKEIPTLPVD